MEYNYRNALRLGERCLKDHLAQKKEPFLPVLEEILEGVHTRSDQLGLQEIPLDLIIGTYTRGRTEAFAANFMPIMEEGTEFEFKYRALITAHEEEGIRDPIQVFEYLHYYYVVEGNKRVSVMKLFGAASITANVTRLIPQRSSAPEIRAYYEFLDFYRIAPVNFLILSKPGDYPKLQKHLGISDGTKMTLDEFRDLRSSFYHFQSAYRSLGGSSITKLTEGNAYLIYLDFYGYERARLALDEEIRLDLRKIWDEYRIFGEEEAVEIVTATPEDRQSILDRFFGSDKPLQVAFIFEKTAETHNWTYAHELGRQHVEDVFGGKVLTKVYDNTDLPHAEEVIEKAVKEGADLIFAASSRYLDACLRAAVAWPNARILCCALNFAHRYVRTYFARTYEAKFVSGVIAGAMAGSSDIGYVASCPIQVNILNLNAFANGVKMVNPRAKVHVVWTEQIGADPKAVFWDRGISIISGSELATPANPDDRDFGLYRYNENHEVERLAMALWNWGAVYERIIDSVKNGGWEDIRKKSGHRAMNYFWGFDSGAIELIINKTIPEGVSRLARFLVSSIRTGAMEPFYGILNSQNGTISDDEDETLLMKDLMEMGWLLDNSVGSIPPSEEFKPEARLLLEAQGVHESGQERY